MSSEKTYCPAFTHHDFDADCLYPAWEVRIEEGGKLSKETMEALKSPNDDDEANTKNLFSDEEYNKRIYLCDFTSTLLPMPHQHNSENTTL